MPSKAKNSQKRAPVYLWTGLGWGKTTSSLGAALRCLGHGLKVTIIQFMKGRGQSIGEYAIRDQLGPLYEIHQFGRPGWINLNKPSAQDKAIARQGLKAALGMAKKKPYLLVLDEINLAVACGLLDEKHVLAFLDKIPAKVYVYMTGRYATPRLMLRADYVTEVMMVKGPKKMRGEMGIDY
ncbi:MAG TPA: cob(I)yrinic acid a,c-diamide adenosyltransferase [Candidatus Nanoarchaeia archaeon]|nr:cob(I)yrinic acid a,c-diamide adenosyltransferase [Candidatus Nanoarchaeia archaeon]